MTGPQPPQWHGGDSWPSTPGPDPSYPGNPAPGGFTPSPPMAPPGVAPQVPPPSPPQRRGALPVLLVIGGVVLVMVLLCGGLGVFAFLKWGGGSDDQKSPSAGKYNPAKVETLCDVINAEPLAKVDRTAKVDTPFHQEDRTETYVFMRCNQRWYTADNHRALSLLADASFRDPDSNSRAFNVTRETWQQETGNGSSRGDLTDLGQAAIYRSWQTDLYVTFQLLVWDDNLSLDLTVEISRSRTTAKAARNVAVTIAKDTMKKLADAS